MKENNDKFPGVEEFAEILRAAFDENDLGKFAAGENVTRIYDFSLLLRSENAKYNLTAITDAAGIAYLHFADSLKIADCIPDNAKLLDVGSGAGFPAIPLAVVRPDLQITALDSTQKRVDFINMAAAQLGLRNLHAICSRAEDFSSKDGREAYDFVTARAVAPLGILSELCIPAVKVGGTFASMKGDKGAAEAKSSENALKKLGAQLEFVDSYFLSTKDGHAERTIVKIRKENATPSTYPRAYAQIKKKPLF